MADQATETTSSKIISNMEENTSSDHFKVDNSTPVDNSTLDEYEKEFERVMQEQEKLEIYRRNAETVASDCDIARGHKRSVSPVIREDEYLIPIDCAPYELNPVHTKNTQSRNNSEQSLNGNSASALRKGNEYLIPIDCAPYELNRIQNLTQSRENSEQSLNGNSVLALTSGNEYFIHNDCAPCELNPVLTLTQGRNNSERSLNESVSALTSGGKHFISIDCVPCQLNPVQTPTQGKNNSEPSRTISVESTAKSGDKSSLHINLKQPPTQSTIKTHTQALGNSELFRNKSSRIDYPTELNPFSDDDETGRGKSTNPFGDSDDEENGLLPPTPRPRHSFSTVKGLEHQNRLPVPLPRTASKSMPTTPNQSPLLRVNHSPSGSTYNSIRRKKKPAPPPPNLSIPDSLQSPIGSPKTSNRPRKTRLAPPPPKPDTTTPS